MPPNRRHDSAKFTGTATPDPSNAGRYTLELAVAVAADPVNFDTVIYQRVAGCCSGWTKVQTGTAVPWNLPAAGFVGRAAGGQKGSGENPIEKEAIAITGTRGMAETAMPLSHLKVGRLVESPIEA